MKHSTPDSMKFKKLQRRLGVSRKEVVGTLELLWIATQTNARRGDIGRYSNEEIAIECDWEGDPDHLIDSLVESGWLDRCEVHRLVVHDWQDHAPRYVHAWVKSQKTTFAKAVSAEATTEAPIEATIGGTVEATVEGGTPNQTKPHPTKPNQTTPNQTQICRSESDGGVTPQDVFDYWNEQAEEPTKRVRKLTPERTRKLRTRLSDPEWPWQEAIDKLPIPNTASFDWQPRFDWLIENGTNAVKIAEGNYDRNEIAASDPRGNLALLERYEANNG